MSGYDDKIAAAEMLAQAERQMAEMQRIVVECHVAEESLRKTSTRLTCYCFSIGIGAAVGWVVADYFLH